MGSSIDVLSEGEIGVLGIHVVEEEKEVEGGQAAMLLINLRGGSNRRPFIHAVGLLGGDFFVTRQPALVLLDPFQNTKNIAVFGLHPFL